MLLNPRWFFETHGKNAEDQASSQAHIDEIFIDVDSNIRLLRRGPSREFRGDFADTQHCFVHSNFKAMVV